VNLVRLRTRAHTAAWGSFAIFFVFIGARPIYRDLAAYSTHAPSVFHTTDSFLRFATDSPVSSEDLIARFDALPASQGLLIFFNSKDPRSSLLQMVAGYLAWPHPVRAIDLSVADSRKSVLPTAGMFVFCRVPGVPSPDVSYGGNLQLLRRR
jgi:hypothetical protein